MLRGQLNSFFVELLSTLHLVVRALHFSKFAQFVMRVSIVRIELQTCFIMNLSFTVLPIIIVRTGNVKVTFSRIRVEFKCHLVGIDRLFVLAHHVISIAEIVESGSVVGVQSNTLFVLFSSFVELDTHAVSITQVVEGFGLCWVQADCFKIVRNCFVDFAKKVKSVTQIVVNV